MSAQIAKQRFASITTIIKELSIAGLWLEEGAELCKADDHLKPKPKKDTLLLDALCNILVRSPGDDVATLIIVQQSGAQLLMAQSTRATGLKEPIFQAPRVAIEPPSDVDGILGFVLEHLRSSDNNKKVSFKNHAAIVTSYLRRIYQAQDNTVFHELEQNIICYILGMSLPKTIGRLYTKNAGLPQYVGIFSRHFRRELLGDMTTVFRVEAKKVETLLYWASKCLKHQWNPIYYFAALQQIDRINPSSMQFTEYIAAVVHEIIYTVLRGLFVVRMARLDLETLRLAVSAQLFLSALLYELRPFVEAYLHSIDPEKLYQSLSHKDNPCEELSGSEEDEESNEIQVMKDDRRPWSEICSYMLDRIALISTSTLKLASTVNVHPSLHVLLSSSSVIAIEPGQPDMTMEHWEDTVDHVMKDIQNTDRIILKDKLRKVVCKRTSVVFSNVREGESTKPKSTQISKFTGVYHCEVALMALLLRATSDMQRPDDWVSMMKPSYFQRVGLVKLGSSKPCCLICSYVISRICKTDNVNLSSVAYSRSRNYAYPCTLPDELPEAVLSETQLWLENLLRNHLTSTEFQDQLNSSLESPRSNASSSPEFPRDRRFPFGAAFF